MPREMEFCGRCSHLLAPARRKRAQVGERLGVRTVDYGRVCLKCLDRHNLTPVREDTPVAVPAPAPAPAVALDAAQAAMDALPEWIKRDGAAHGRARREAAADEATAKPGRKPAAPVKRYSVTPSIIAREDRTVPMDESRNPAATASLEAPAPVARDIKETPKTARPVRRPARPRREPSAAVLAALAPASDTHDMAALDRMHGTQTSAPAPRPWVHEMPGPTAPARRTVIEEQRRPKPASTPEQRRALALAYAQKRGGASTPPAYRRPIITSEEILATVTDKGEDQIPVEAPTGTLNGHQAAAHLDIGYSTFRSFLKTYGAPPRTRGQGSSWMYEPRELELWHSDIRRASLFDTPGRAA